MVCTNCGSSNRNGRRFCRECGQALGISCDICGAPNDPGDRFCGRCGSELGREPGDDATDHLPNLERDPNERRFVAVLFADLAGFTQFSESRDHEVVRAALTDFYERARTIVEGFGGSVQKFIGDAVMAVWGATVTHEDDAERAVRAGLELVDMVSHLGDELGNLDLALRVGVLTGEASVGPATQELGLVIGDLVNTASRLQSLADPGTVVVGEATYRMLAEAIEFAARGSHSVKGKAAPIEVWRAERVIVDRSRITGNGREPAFVGRTEELRILKDAVHATERMGRSRLVSVIGEAGIGKSRLVRELARYAGSLASPIYWHEGRSPAYGEGLTFWALGEMVRQRAGIAATDDRNRSRTKLRTAVAEYVGSVPDQTWIEPRLAALLGLDDAPRDEPNEFFAAVRNFFEHISDRGTVVMVFEDFHWADQGLIEFVNQLAERSTRYPIVVITLARPDLLDKAPGWGSGRRHSASMQLGPLSDSEMSDLVAAMVQGIGEQVAAVVVERASGIPLYAVELVRMLLADGELVVDDDACIPTGDLSSVRVPDTVRAVVAARLDRLEKPLRALIQDAAVLGAAFTSDGLSAMSGLDSAALDMVLEPLVQREVLEFETNPRSPERGLYRFVQGMIREVAYRRLTREERRSRHSRAAEYFAQLGEIEFAGAVAGHYMSAHGVADDPATATAYASKATSALADAADRAASLHSHEQALGMVEQALEFVVDARVEVALWQKASQSASALALHDRAIGYARQAFDWQQEHGGDAEVASAAALLANKLCHAYRAPQAIEVLEPIVAADKVLSSSAFVAAAAELSRAYLMSLRDAEAAELGERVMGPAEQFGLIPTIVDTLITRGTALGNLGRLHEAKSLLAGATQYAQEHDLALARMRAANNLGHVLAYDDHAGALEACRTGLEQANRVGDVRFIGSFGWAVAAYLDRDGQADEAQALRDRVRDQIELPAGSAAWYELTGLIARVEHGDRNAADAAFEAARRAVDDANPQSAPGLALSMAKLKLMTGELEAAYDHAMHVAETILPDHLGIATLAAGMLGDIDKLEVVAAALHSCQVRGRMVDAYLSAADAAIAALHRRTDEAVAGFTDALAFPFLRLDRAVLQALFAAMVGRDVPAARSASAEASAVLTDVGAEVYLDIFAAGMPSAEQQQVSGS